MKNEKPRILIISSANPTKGPGVVALNGYNAFKDYGYEVDLLTLYQTEGNPEFLSVYNCQEGKNRNFLMKIENKVNRIFRQLNIRQNSEYCFFYRKETCPPIPCRDVLKRIKKKYDVVYIYFWQKMLSYQTIERIYDKLHCAVYFWGVDYSVMAGGCHFTGDCQRYKTGCGCCPGIYSTDSDDFTSFNVKFRRKVLAKVHPIVCGNKYMQTFYRQSYLLKDYDRIETVYPIIDHKLYSPIEKSLLRAQFQISVNKNFIFFFGAQSLNDKRKGISYLLEALEILYKQLTEEERDSILLLLAGKDIEPIKDKLLFDYRHLGFVSSEELPKIYSLANAFLSPSVNDAGPLMVNQSLSCGTPVIAFKMGTALDMVKDKRTGYCAKLRDSKDFAKGMEYVFRLSKNEYTEMSKRCRNMALELTSEEAFIKRFLNLYNLYKEKDS